MSKIIKSKKKIVMSILIILISVACVLIWLSPIVQTQRLLFHAKAHSEFTFESALDFNWDMAIIDTQAYGTGEWIKEKYGLSFTVKEHMLDDVNRILFFKKGRLVKELRYGIVDLKFENVELIKEDTVFTRKMTPFNSVILSVKD